MPLPCTWLYTSPLATGPKDSSNIQSLRPDHLLPPGRHLLVTKVLVSLPPLVTHLSGFSSANPVQRGKMEERGIWEEPFETSLGYDMWRRVQAYWLVKLLSNLIWGSILFLFFFFSSAFQESMGWELTLCLTRWIILLAWDGFSRTGWLWSEATFPGLSHLEVAFLKWPPPWEVLAFLSPETQLLSAFRAQGIPRNPGRKALLRKTDLSSSGSHLLCMSQRAPAKKDQSGWGFQAMKGPTVEDKPKERKQQIHNEL